MRVAAHRGGDWTPPSSPDQRFMRPPMHSRSAVLHRPVGCTTGAGRELLVHLPVKAPVTSVGRQAAAQSGSVVTPAAAPTTDNARADALRTAISIETALSTSAGRGRIAHGLTLLCRALLSGQATTLLSGSCGMEIWRRLRGLMSEERVGVRLGAAAGQAYGVLLAQMAKRSSTSTSAKGEPRRSSRQGAEEHRPRASRGRQRAGEAWTFSSTRAAAGHGRWVDVGHAHEGGAAHAPGHGGPRPLTAESAQHCVNAVVALGAPLLAATLASDGRPTRELSMHRVLSEGRDQLRAQYVGCRFDALLSIVAEAARFYRPLVSALPPSAPAPPPRLSLHLICRMPSNGATCASRRDIRRLLAAAALKCCEVAGQQR